MKIFNQVATEFKIRSHDKKLLLVLLVAVVLLRVTPTDLALSIMHSYPFQQLLWVNLFAAKMASHGSNREYLLYCYGMSTLLVPYCFYSVFTSADMRAGVVRRFDDGGRGALVISAIACLVFIFFIFNIDFFYSPGSPTRQQNFIYESRNGIALMSVGFTFLIGVLSAAAARYGYDYFKQAAR
jgi:hypothetical protein